MLLAPIVSWMLVALGTLQLLAEEHPRSAGRRQRGIFAERRDEEVHRAVVVGRARLS